GLEGERLALEGGADAHRQADVALRLADRGDRLAERGPGTGVEGEHGGRELAQMVDGERRLAHADPCYRAQGHLAAARRRQIDVVERVDGVVELRIGGENDPVVVRLRINGGDDALTEGVVERV